jgi:hypothetical protein
MAIKQDLKALQKEFKALGPKMEKLTKAIGFRILMIGD